MGFFSGGLGRVLAGVGTGGLSEVGGLLSNGQKMPGYDINGQMKLVDSSNTAQKGIVTGNQTKLAALNPQYKADMGAAADKAQADSRASSQQFMSDIGQSSDKLGENLSTALYRRTMASAPQMQDQLRESLAGTGGLNRGAADAAFTRQNADLAGRLFEGNADIGNQQLAARQDAMTKAQSVDQGLIRDRLGIDTDTLSKIYASGRQDLIDEANGLLGIEQNTTGQKLGLLGVQQNSNIAMANADATRQAGLTNALLGMAGTVGGAVAGGPMGAMAGNSLASSMSSSPRGAVDSVQPYTYKPTYNSLPSSLSLR